MPPQAEPKKRPPPITIPLPYKPRAIPGPNAFAVTTNAKQDGPNRNKDERRSANDTPVSSPLEDVILPAPGSQHSRKDGSSRGSAMTAVMEFARGSSPRKSDGLSSTNNRHGPAPMSSTKSRYSHRSHRSATSSRPGTAGQKSTGEEEDHATVRSQIESRAEKKLFKMMGQIPGSPAAGKISKSTPLCPLRRTCLIEIPEVHMDWPMTHCVFLYIFLKLTLRRSWQYDFIEYCVRANSKQITKISPLCELHVTLMHSSPKKLPRRNRRSPSRAQRKNYLA
jgi:hypothetical protein